MGDGEPAELFSLVSLMIEACSPESTLPRRRGWDITHSLDDFVAAFIELKSPETTALLALLSELSRTDDALKGHCRRELDKRDDALPVWLAELARTEVYRVMRRAHVLGDGDQLLLGVRLADRRELTFAVYVDHLALSRITEALLLARPLATVRDIAEAGGDRDTAFAEFGPADARAYLEKALDNPLSDIAFGDSEHWPESRALLRWLVRLLPDGGSLVPQQESTEVLERFFASWAGAPFTGGDYEVLLENFVDQGTRDPLRWSAERLRQLLKRPDYDDRLELTAQLNAPALLRAYVPFAHAESEIRHQLTAEAIAVIDAMADSYRNAVLADARRYDCFDEDEA